MLYFPKGPRLHKIDDKVDTLDIMLTMMVMRMILVQTLQGWLEPDRIDSVPGHHSVIIPIYDIHALYVLLLYKVVLLELRLVLRIINRDSILTKPEQELVEPSFEIIGSVMPLTDT